MSTRVPFPTGQNAQFSVFIGPSYLWGISATSTNPNHTGSLKGKRTGLIIADEGLGLWNGTDSEEVWTFPKSFFQHGSGNIEVVTERLGVTTKAFTFPYAFKNIPFIALTKFGTYADNDGGAKLAATVALTVSAVLSTGFTVQCSSSTAQTVVSSINFRWLAVATVPRS